jgi:hypothetical protein
VKPSETLVLLSLFWPEVPALPRARGNLFISSNLEKREDSQNLLLIGSISIIFLKSVVQLFFLGARSS